MTGMRLQACRAGRRAARALRAAGLALALLAAAGSGLPAAAAGMAVENDDRSYDYTGPEARRHERALLSAALPEALLNGPCAGGEGDDALVVLESDPRVLGAAEDELNRQRGPGWDPATTGRKRWGEPTHRAQGELVIEDGRVTVRYRVTSVADGSVRAQAERSGDAADPWPVLQAALAALNEALCGGAGEWEGTVTVQESSNQLAASVRRGEPGARISGRLSLVVRLGRLQTLGVLSFSHSIVGSGGSIETVATGQVPVGVTVAVEGGRVVVDVGLVTVQGMTTARMEGGGYSGPEKVQVGPWRAQGPPVTALGDRQAGQHSQPVPGGQLRIGWELHRRTALRGG